MTGWAASGSGTSLNLLELPSTSATGYVFLAEMLMATQGAATQR